MTEIMNENRGDNLTDNLKDMLSRAEVAPDDGRVLEAKSFAAEEDAKKLSIDDLDSLIPAAAAYGYAKKAHDIVGIDLRGISPVADYFLIFSGSNKPQIKAISDNIEEKLSEQGIRPLRVEGYREAEWILLDYGALVVHIFDDEQRAYYNLEHLWGDAPAYRFVPAE